MQFDENGVCHACNFNELKWEQEIDWDEREKELIELCDQYRKTDGSYDCIVGGSGGKDSAMQSHLLKYKYGMNPPDSHLVAASLHRHRLEEFPELAACRRVRQLPLHPQRQGAPTADPQRHDQPAPPVPALHPGPKDLRRKDGAALATSADLLWRDEANMARTSRTRPRPTPRPRVRPRPRAIHWITQPERMSGTSFLAGNRLASISMRACRWLSS